VPNLTFGAPLVKSLRRFTDTPIGRQLLQVSGAVSDRCAQ